MIEEEDGRSLHKRVVAAPVEDGFVIIGVSDGMS